MITNGWLDWTTIKAGIPDKVYSQANSGALGLACHSVVGFEGDFEDGIPNRFLSTAKNPDGTYTAYASASCMFILRYSGELIQMYPTRAATWTSGSRGANCSTWAIEAEGGTLHGPGGYDEPLRLPQVQTMMRLAREWEAWSGRKIVRLETLWEHNELALKFGSSATACPSARYENFYAAWENQEEDDMGMTPEERAMLDDLYLATFSGSEENNLSRQQRLANAAYRVSQRALTAPEAEWSRSVADVAQSAQEVIMAHEANHPGGSGDGNIVTGTFTGVIE